MLLQTRGRVTAAEVAVELEVSERTARRDLDALAVAGAPIYSRRGRHGGWELIGGARTDLSGLTAAEARALFLVAGPEAGARPEVRAALRKLTRALPEPFRGTATAASRAIVADPIGWGGRRPQPPDPAHLDELQRAVVEGEVLELAYVARDRTPTTRDVHPLGLASKAGVWYLIAATDAGLRSFRVDRVAGTRRTGRPVERPPDFDLEAAWRMVAARVDEHWARTVVTAAARPFVIGALRSRFGDRLRIGPPRADGDLDVEIAGPDLRAVVGVLAGWADAVCVTGPPEARSLLAALGRRLVADHGDDATGDATDDGTGANGAGPPRS